MLVASARAGILLSIHCVRWSLSSPGQSYAPNSVSVRQRAFLNRRGMIVNGGQMQTLARDISDSGGKLCAKMNLLRGIT